MGGKSYPKESHHQKRELLKPLPSIGKPETKASVMFALAILESGNKYEQSSTISAVIKRSE